MDKLDQLKSSSTDQVKPPHGYQQDDKFAAVSIKLILHNKSLLQDDQFRINNQSIGAISIVGIIEHIDYVYNQISISDGFYQIRVTGKDLCNSCKVNQVISIIGTVSINKDYPVIQCINFNLDAFEEYAYFHITEVIIIEL